MSRTRRLVSFVRRAGAAFARDARGATAIEYSLIIALIFLAIVAAVRNYTASTSDMYSTINSVLP
ncbi:MAG: Flp family type IVb pilin [Parvularculaceae bacterium]|nr:Flp family type IVb pilin [Parvularculaceae bacterium]